MRPFHSLMFGMAILATAATAYAQDGGVYVVTYVDVMPNAAPHMLVRFDQAKWCGR